MKGRASVCVVIAVVVLISLVVADASVHRPRRARLVALASEAEQTEQGLLYLARNSDDLRRVTAYLPTGQDGSCDAERLFLSQVSEVSARLGLSVTRVEPRGEASDGNFMRRSYRLRLEGGYHAFAGFLEHLEMLPEVVLIESFDYKTGVPGTGARHKATVLLTVVGH